MPTVLRINGFRFYFYSADKGEPPHVHVERGDGVGKWWIDPVRCASHSGFKRQELISIERIIATHRNTILEMWHEYFPR